MFYVIIIRLIGLTSHTQESLGRRLSQSVACSTRILSRVRQSDIVNSQQRLVGVPAQCHVITSIEL